MMASKPQTPERRSQAERRAETHKQVLDSACRLFGEKGYASTSLEDIGIDCGLTTRPIYHYFGNKKALFAAVNEAMENRIIETVYNDNASSGLMANWRSFLSVCKDRSFRQIVLIDSPNVLGRERWASSAVTLKALEHFNSRKSTPLEQFRQQLLSRMIMASFAEAALMIAEAEDIEMATQEADALVERLFSHF